MTSGNLGPLDRALRVVLALVAIASPRFFVGASPDAVLMVVLPAFLAFGYLLLTAAIGEDLVYAMLDVDTLGRGLHVHKHLPRPWRH